MQENVIIPHWAQLTLTAIASILTTLGIPHLYNNWLNRKKPAADIHVTEATATEITVRSTATAGDAVVRFMDRLNVAQETIDRLRSERDSWQDEYDKVFVERDQLLQDNAKREREVEFVNDELKWMKSVIDAAGVKLSDYDYLRRKRQDG